MIMRGCLSLPMFFYFFTFYCMIGIYLGAQQGDQTLLSAYP